MALEARRPQAAAGTFEKVLAAKHLAAAQPDNHGVVFQTRLAPRITPVPLALRSHYARPIYTFPNCKARHL